MPEMSESINPENIKVGDDRQAGSSHNSNKLSSSGLFS